MLQASYGEQLFGQGEQALAVRLSIEHILGFSVLAKAITFLEAVAEEPATSTQPYPYGSRSQAKSAAHSR